MRRRSLWGIFGALALVLALGGAALAQQPGQGQGSPPPFAPGAVVIEASDDHGDASASYAAADVVDSLTLGEGAWKITATGAVSLDGDPVALNCGLRIADDDSGTGHTMLAKQNPATGGEEGRVGFSVVGSLVTDEETPVELVCFGGGNLPFEHNMVAIGGAVE